MSRSSAWTCWRDLGALATGDEGIGEAVGEAVLLRSAELASLEDHQGPPERGMDC